MSKYNMNRLNHQEITLLKALLFQYKDYDKLDILIELIASPDFFTRDVKNGYKTKKIEVIQPMPQGVMYCDGDSCEVDYSKQGGC